MPKSTRKNYRAGIRSNAFITIADDINEDGGTCFSGAGSTVEVTKKVREIIVDTVKQYDIKTMLDIPCGDFTWMPLTIENFPDDVQYIGGDIVPFLVERNGRNYPQYTFKVIDFVKDDLPECDLIFCRDALQHLAIADIKQALENFSRSGAKYLLTTIHLRRSVWQNKQDCRIGSCRDRNLLIEPFNLGDPLVIFSEVYSHKFLGLWELPLRYYSKP